MLKVVFNKVNKPRGRMTVGTVTYRVYTDGICVTEKHIKDWGVPESNGYGILYIGKDESVDEKIKELEERINKYAGREDYLNKTKR